MPHFITKKKKGRPYLYVREVQRINGKPRTVWQRYIGSPERVLKLVEGGGSDLKQLKVEEFGSVFVANLLDRDIDLAGIIDGVVPPDPHEKGPSVGEYFLYAVLNRMIEAQSKNRLSQWYERTAIQTIRAVELGALSSQRYWEKWERVDEQALDEIARRFFARVWEVERPEADCVVFDTTNYYTFMASQTDSELARRGKNKEGRHNLRQVGLALLVARGSRLPLYSKVYRGNLHNSRLFGEVMQEMFGVVEGLRQTKSRLTVVIDKGMNGEQNYAWIDDHLSVHFITSYSTYHAEELAQVPLKYFAPAEIKKNRRLEAEGLLDERLLVYRTAGDYWGRERTVVVSYNPATARKQSYTFASKLDQLREELLVMRTKVRNARPQWRDAEAVRERYLKVCERLHIAAHFYALDFEATAGGLSMSFRKDHYQIQRQQARFGKNIIITDNSDWTTAGIIQAALDRWEVEAAFRQSKDDDLVAAQPLRHWTDAKIRCHLFTCVVALTYLRRLELRLAAAALPITAQRAMDELRHLHSVITIDKAARKPLRRVETPTKTQREVLKAFGYAVDPSGVLRLLKQ